MSLSRLTVKNLRNIEHVELSLGSGVNLVCGVNGSGKTSLLEAIYFLGSGRTFRGQRIEPLISRDASGCTVFGVVDADRRCRIGVQRGRDGGRDIKINGEVVRRASELALALPVLMLGPDTVDLLLGAPGPRRRFLNWGLFHVEHGFLSEWENATRGLKQRNSLLRAGRASNRELAVWTDKLEVLAEAIDAYRRRYFEKLQAVFKVICGDLTGLQEVECVYSRGWDSNRSLKEVMASQLDGDIKRGFTLSGFQKADIELRVAGQSASSVCSRGELKILAWALVLSQGKLSMAQQHQAPVYLVDDLCAELDEHHRQSVCRELVNSGGQIVATGIDLEQLQGSWSGITTKMFHVKRGVFSELESSNE